jgi:hypothetical protein
MDEEIVDLTIKILSKKMKELFIKQLSITFEDGDKYVILKDSD